MKISKAVWSILVLGGITTSLFAQDFWTRKADFPGPGRYGAAAFSIGDKGYIGLGSVEGGYLSDFWEYDPATDTWSQKADFEGHARNSAAGFSLGDKGYFTSGSYTPGDYDWEWYNDLWEYDPSANDWTQQASYDALGRGLPVAFTIGDKAYVGTGTYRLDRAHDAIYLDDFWEYDPATDSWQQKANVPQEGRTSATGLSIGNKGYVGLGYYYYDTVLKDWWEYDPAEDVWTRKGDFPGTKRVQAFAYTIGERGYVGGGGYYSPLKDFWEYNPLTDSWSRKADLLLGFGNAPATFSIGARAFIATGWNEAEQFTHGVFEYRLSLPGVTNFSLVDIRTEKKIIDFDDTVALDVGHPDFRYWTIRANTYPERVGSVLFRIDDVRMNIENKPPYLLAGYRLRAVASGEHVLEAEAFTQRLGRGDELQSRMAVLHFVNKTAVNRFVVLDASGQEVQELRDGDVLNAHDPRLMHFNIGAELTQSAYRGSVRFSVNGEPYRNENQSPYLMVSGNRKWWSAPGSYTVSALPYSKKNSNGVPGVALTVNFVITDEETPSEPALTSYVELNNLVVVYKNTNGGVIPDYYPDSLSKALEETNKFYWRQSYMAFNLRWSVYVIEEHLERVHENGYVFPHEVDADLRARGFPVDSFDAVSAVVRGGGAYAWGTDNILGRGSYFQVPWWEEHYLFSWFFVHEFHHILDAMFASSGHPEYPHNHPGAARAMGEYVPHSGVSWDLNREILRNWDRLDWFKLTNNGHWGKIKTAVDADADSIPDVEPNVPFDEVSFSSSPTLVDTDGDKLTDLQEAMMGIFTPSDPMSADTDGDGLADATDAEPLYPIKTTVPKVVNLSVDQNISDWPIAGNYFFNRSSADRASLHMAYSENNLYIGARIPKDFIRVEILIDGNNDGIFYGRDNIWLILDYNSGIASVRLFDAASVPPGDFQDFIITDLPHTGFTQTTRRDTDGVSFQLQIPRLTDYGLDLTEAEQIGIFMHIDGYALLLEHDDLLTLTLGGSETEQLAATGGANNSTAIAKQFVYPNPASSIIAIDCNTDDIAGNWRIIDSHGTEHMRNTFAAAGPAIMNIEALPAGLYLLHVQSAAGKKVFWFIKN